MANADFWRKRKEGFTHLSVDEYRAVPDPADDRRLYAYGDYTSVRDGGIGCLFRSGAIVAGYCDLHARAEADRIGITLPMPVTKALHAGGFSFS